MKLGLQFRYQNGQVQVNHNHFLGYTKDADGNLIIDLEQAEEKKTLKVAMECSYAPYNWTQPDDSNGAVPISGSSDYAYGYDVMMAKKICDEMG